jgi:hypothetical protein
LWYQTKLFNPLFPLIELFNYKVEPSARLQVDKETDDVSIIATEAIEKGEEVPIYNNLYNPNRFSFTIHLCPTLICWISTGSLYQTIRKITSVLELDLMTTTYYIQTREDFLEEEA